MRVIVTHRRSRAMSLTPMIDVVFLLLVFFMLAARFGVEDGIPVAAASGTADYTGPPRLVEISPGEVRLNGSPVALPDLSARVLELTEAPADLVVVRPIGGASVQDLVDVVSLLRAASLETVAIVE